MGKRWETEKKEKSKRQSRGFNVHFIVNPIMVELTNLVGNIKDTTMRR